MRRNITINITSASTSSCCCCCGNDGTVTMTTTTSHVVCRPLLSINYTTHHRNMCRSECSLWP